MEELKEFGKGVLAVIIGLIIAVGVGMAGTYGFTYFLEHMEGEMQSESTNQKEGIDENTKSIS